jgi:hypothetical protein
MTISLTLVIPYYVFHACDDELARVRNNYICLEVSVT